ncbi:hypothetical protein [uncultured Paraglaciecola sp.]|nr:hypothetical protein [uncultured Paraglaciecola sp.]
MQPGQQHQRGLPQHYLPVNERYTLGDHSLANNEVRTAAGNFIAVFLQ